MFQSLLASLESANFKSAVRRGRLACPSCGSKPAAVPAAKDDVIPCATCGTAASALEWSGSRDAREIVGHPDEPPAHTRITREMDFAGAVTWKLPASGKSGGMMFFALFWCTITGLLTFGFLFAKKQPGGDLTGWGLVLFFSLFWAVGLGMLYAACRSKYARHRVTAGRSMVTLRRELFGSTTEKRLAAADIESIAAVEFYQQNYRPVHGIEIRSSRGKLRFGSMLTEEEKAWLVADLQRVVGVGHSGAALRASGEGRSGTSALPAPLEHFSIPLPDPPRLLLVPGLILAIGGLAAMIGPYLLEAPFFAPDRFGEGPTSFDFFYRSFAVFWIVGCSMNIAIGVALLTRHAKTREQKRHLEGTKEEVALRTTKFGRIVEQQCFPRRDVVDARASTSGHQNGKPMKRIELLVGGKAHPLARWVTADEARAFVAEVRRALGLWKGQPGREGL